MSEQEEQEVDVDTGIEDRLTVLENKIEAQALMIEKLEARLQDVEDSKGGKGGGKGGNDAASDEAADDDDESTAAPEPTKAKAAAAARPKSKRSGSIGKKARRPSTGDSKSSSKPKKLGSEKKLLADSLPENRRGQYQVGKTKVPYVLPEEYAGQGGTPGKEPNMSLQLEFAYGYSGRTTHGNVKFFSKSEEMIVYSLAGAGVIYNVEDNSQTFMTQHSEDVISLALHPDGTTVATGQIDPKGLGTPFICIWDETGSLKHKITYHQRGICALAFSPDGKFLASVGNDDNHTLAIHAWESKRDNDEPNLTLSLSKEEVYTIDFHPSPKADSDYTIVALGVKTLKLISLSKEAIKGKLKAGEGVEVAAPSTYKTTDIIQKSFNGVAFGEAGVFWLATQSGAVYQMKHDVLLTHWKAHSKFGGAICRTANGQLVTVGDDGKLKIWEDNDKLSKEHDIGSTRKVRSMDVLGNKVVCGTNTNELFSVDLDGGDAVPIMAGHSDQVWALAVHPDGQFIVTGAHDHRIMVWDTYEKALSDDKPKKSFKANVRAAAFSPDGTLLAVTLGNGKLVIVNWADWEVVYNEKLGKEQCDSVAFSPTSKSLAVGSWDQNIYLFSVAKMKKLKTYKGHASSVIALQWSADGNQLMSNSKDYEVLYWDVKKGEQIKFLSEVADTQWATWQCILGWAVVGIWGGTSDGTDVNTVDRSANEQLVVAGDDFGGVRLYSYPSLGADSPCVKASGHSSHVTTVRFSKDGSRIYSTGGADCAVFQWSLKDVV